ncbi:MAG: hypothetical protein KAX64_00940 [Chromatiaceae bacterium]|jgi:hypothetical protein|nr:hypothetical protein [Chromatiaceae bacterium]
MTQAPKLGRNEMLSWTTQSLGRIPALIQILVKNPIGTLVLAITLLFATEALAEDPGAAPRAAMADAMSRMMEAMGFLNPPTSPGLPMTTPLSGMPGGFSIPGMTGMPGSSSWPAPGGDPSGLMGKGGEVMKQMTEGMKSSGGALSSSPGSRLDGVWEGRNGELLIVQGNRFRIYPGSSGYVDGYLQLSGDRLAMYNPENAHISPFDFAESDGRLALRDRNGSHFLYRRLWLDQPTPPLPSPAAADK